MASQPESEAVITEALDEDRLADVAVAHDEGNGELEKLVDEGGLDSPAHQLWEAVNWLWDQRDLEPPEGKQLSDVDQELLVIHEESSVASIHHTYSSTIPDGLGGELSSLDCHIGGTGSQISATDNVVHSIVWIVPDELGQEWQQPDSPSYSPHEDFVTQEDRENTASTPVPLFLLALSMWLAQRSV